jgi:hypothetical protein
MTTVGAPVHNASLKAMIRHDGSMVAVLASVTGGPARFFIAEPRESQDEFVGRVSRWVKASGGTGLAMLEPEVLPEGIETGEVLLRIKHAIGISREAADASEYEIANVELVSAALTSKEN